MRRKLCSYLVFPLLLLLGNSSGKSAATVENNRDRQAGTLEKMIIADGHVVMELDLNRLNGTDAGANDAKRDKLEFQIGPNSFFTILVFDDVFREGPATGTMEIIPASIAPLPAMLRASLGQLVLEKLPRESSFDLAVRDSKTGFVFFNIAGNLYEYEPTAQRLTIKEGRLLISDEFAQHLGRSAEAGSVAGGVSIVASVSAIESTTIADGAPQSSVLPPAPRRGGSEVPNSVPGPDVIVGDVFSLQQFGSSATQVGVALGTTSCNNGSVPINWFAMPNTDHPVIPQNLYRMSGGTAETDRFEQIGQSWLKHASSILAANECGFGCTISGSGLGVGCSDAYGSQQNATQNGLGSRAWVNPFTGVFPSTAKDHTGHNDTGSAPTHRMLVEMSDLNSFPGATYYAEAQYVTPHEYAWCQTHPGQCNMYNNVSYRRFAVTGESSFTFKALGPTVQMSPAINAWTGATIRPIEPAPGVDGRAFIAWKVTGPVAGIWHYEYAINNQNLDRAIQSFSVPLGCGITLTNVGFHAPPQHPGIANDGTQGNAGYSNAAWTPNQTAGALTWSTETFAQNQNANAIRWGTLYNFRFDSDRPPLLTNATIGYFKNGTPSTVVIQAPNACNATPTPIPTVTPVATSTPTPGVSATPAATPTPTPTVTPTPVITPTPGVTPSPTPTMTPVGTPCRQTTFSNTAFINMPDSGPASFYPSNLIVAGLTGTVTKVAVKLNGWTHTRPSDVDILLVGPGGQNAIIVSDVGGSNDMTDVTLTLDDAAPNALPAAQLTSGTFRPTNLGTGDTFSAPAPTPAGGSAFLIFNGTNPNGTWSLYAYDDSEFEMGNIAGGWELNISTTTDLCTPTPTPPSTASPTATPAVTPTATPTATATIPPTPSPSPSIPSSPTPPPPTPPNSTPTPTATPNPTPHPTSTPMPPAQATNLSTRMRVQSGDNVGIGGFIIVGTAPKHVLLRAIGPSLSQAGVPNGLADPVLELHGPGGFTTITNDDWRDDPLQEAAILATGIAPTNNLESAIDSTLNPGAYTAVVRGQNNTSGVGLVEIYDLSPAVAGKLVNISTRAFVGPGDNIVIAGFILGGNTGDDRILLRGIGPSLTTVGVANPLADPMLELRDANGALLIANNDWQDDAVQAADLTAAGLAPTNALESGIAATLPPGLYTALLGGLNNGTGIGLVEVYDRGP